MPLSMACQKSRCLQAAARQVPRCEISSEQSPKSLSAPARVP